MRYIAKPTLRNNRAYTYNRMRAIHIMRNTADYHHVGLRIYYGLWTSDSRWSPRKNARIAILQQIQSDMSSLYFERMHAAGYVNPPGVHIRMASSLFR